MLNAYFKTNSFKIYHGDSSSILLKLEDNSVDVVFADPPYFLSSGRKMDIAGRKVSFEKGLWDRCRTTEEVDSFNESWINAVIPKMKDDATIWVCGTFHNIFSVERILVKNRFKIINIISWQKSNPHEIIDGQHLTFSTEFIIWARKSYHGRHVYNHELMLAQNGGKPLTDVWKLPTPAGWEKKCGKHPTQKPLRLLYRIILACSREGDTILDPFAGSCTTGIAANLLGRKFIGIDQSEEFLQLGIRRLEEISDISVKERFLRKISETPEETMVLVNHARKETRELMIEKGICYMRAGESDGSLQVTPGFERMKYVLLHTGGKDAQMFHIKKGKEGSFSIWTKEALEKHGFRPEHAAYYIVVPFENTPTKVKKLPDIVQRINTYRAKIRPLSDFIGIK